MRLLMLHVALHACKRLHNHHKCIWRHKNNLFEKGLNHFLQRCSVEYADIFWKLRGVKMIDCSGGCYAIWSWWRRKYSEKEAPVVLRLYIWKKERIVFVRDGSENIGSSRTIIHIGQSCNFLKPITVGEMFSGVHISRWVALWVEKSGSIRFRNISLLKSLFIWMLKYERQLSTMMNTVVFSGLEEIKELLDSDILKYGLFMCQMIKFCGMFEGPRAVNLLIKMVSCTKNEPIMSNWKVEIEILYHYVMNTLKTDGKSVVEFFSIPFWLVSEWLQHWEKTLHWYCSEPQCARWVLVILLHYNQR